MSLKRNLAANYVGQAWAAVMGLAFLPLYIRYLGPEALGLIGVFAMLQAWLALLDLGITPTLTREMARFTAGGHTPKSIADLLRSLEVVCASLAACIVVVLWAASGYLAAQWLRPKDLPVEVVRQALVIMGAVVALRFYEGLYRGALLGLQRHVLFNVLNAALATLRHGGAVAVLAFVSPTIGAFYVWQAVLSAIAVVTLAVGLRRSLPPPPSPARLSRQALVGIRGFAGGMLAITCLSLLVSQMDKLLLSRLLSLDHFGYYTLAATIAGVLNMAVSPIVQSVYPRLVELVTAGDEHALAGVYHQGAQLVSVTTAPAMLLLTLFPWGVVYVWSGDASLADATRPLLLPLALGTFLNALMWMPYQSQLAHGWTSLTIRANIVAVLITVPAILVLVPRQGATAAAWIWTILNAAYVLLAVPLMHRRILRHEQRRWYASDVGIPVGAALLAGGALALLAPGPDAHRTYWAAFLLLVSAATAVAAFASAGRLRAPAIAWVRRRVQA